MSKAMNSVMPKWRDHVKREDDNLHSHDDTCTNIRTQKETARRHPSIIVDTFTSWPCRSGAKFEDMENGPATRCLNLFWGQCTMHGSTPLSERRMNRPRLITISFRNLDRPQNRKQGENSANGGLQNDHYFLLFHKTLFLMVLFKRKCQLDGA